VIRLTHRLRKLATMRVGQSFRNRFVRSIGRFHVVRQGLACRLSGIAGTRRASRGFTEGRFRYVVTIVLVALLVGVSVAYTLQSRRPPSRDSSGP
jgi:hypothetical protein